MKAIVSLSVGKSTETLTTNTGRTSGWDDGPEPTVLYHRWNHLHAVMALVSHTVVERVGQVQCKRGEASASLYRRAACAAT